MKKKRKKVTRPRQAAAPRTVDGWELDIGNALAFTQGIVVILKRMQKSIRNAERR